MTEGLLSETERVAETGWHSTDNSEFVTAKGWKGGDDAVNSYRELEKTLGGKVTMPTEESTPEDVSAFYQKLGRPDEVTGYTRPELAEGQQYDEDLIGPMAAIAHKHGLNDKQFTGFVNEYLAIQEKQAEAKMQAENLEAETTVSELHKEWGGDYEKNLETSKRVVRELIPEDMKEGFAAVLTEKNLDNNITFIKALQSIGAKMLDDTLVNGDLPKEKEGFTPKHINSPEMYQFGEDDESKQSRAYFEAKGHVYN